MVQNVARTLHLPPTSVYLPVILVSLVLAVVLASFLKAPKQVTESTRSRP
jgi:flagellar biosynthesis protein FliQ